MTGRARRATAIFNRKLRRDLGRRRAQVAAVALTVFVGLAVFVLSSGMASNLGDSYELTYDRTSFADVWITGGDELGSAIADIDGVAHIEQRTTADIGVTFADRPIRTRIVGVGPDTELNRLVLTAGDGLDPAGGGVVVEQHAADHFGLGPGDEVVVAGHGPVPIVGVATSPEWLWVAPSPQELIVDPDEFAVLFAPEALAATWAPGSIQIVAEVDRHDPAIADRVAEVALAAGAGEVVTRAEQPSNQTLQADLEGFEQLAISFPILFLAAAGLATSVLLSRLVAQQRPEIAMMRANGYDDGTISGHYVRYGIAVSLLGAVAAVPVGVAGSWAATRAYADFLGIPFASRAVHPETWGLAIVFAVVVGAGSGWVAARRAITVAPAEAMRPGGQSVAGRRTALDRLLPPAAPSWLRLAIRNLARSPGRSLTTATGIVLALVLTVTALVMNDTIGGVVGSIVETDRRGLVVTLDGPADTAALDRLGALDGVTAAEPHLELGASLVAPAGSGADGPVVTELVQVFPAGTDLHDFAPVGGLPSEGIVLSTGAAGELGVSTGDTVEIRAIDGTTGTLTVAAVITEAVAGSSYLSLESWTALGGTPPASVAIGLADRGDHAAVRAEAATVDGVVQITDRVATAERTEELLAGSRFFVGVILALAVLLAGALIFNALSVTIGERETEVATLQANGVGRGWIRRTITTENLTTVALGMVPGLIVGWISAGAFVRQFSTEQFVLDPVLRPASLASAVLVLVACAVVAQLPGLRRLDRLDLPAKVRERAL